MIRVKTEDVLTQLPEMRQSVIPLDISRPFEYARALADFLGWLRDRSPERYKRARKAEQMVKLGYLLRLAAELKLPPLFRFLDGLLQGGVKLLVFAVHKAFITQLCERYGRKALALTGETPAGKRLELVKQFERDDGVRLLVGNVKAAGTGFSIRATSTVVFGEFPWAPGEVLQAAKRAHGLNRGVQGVHTLVYHTVAKDTVEQTLVRLLQQRQRNVSAVLDGRRAAPVLDIYDLLEAELRKG
jgi:superfamily II DNA or RNA helicase